MGMRHLRDAFGWTDHRSVTHSQAIAQQGEKESSSSVGNVHLLSLFCVPHKLWATAQTLRCRLNELVVRIGDDVVRLQLNNRRDRV